VTETVLQEAERLINGDRQQTYGSASESFDRIAKLWGSYLGSEVTGLDVANLMILLKVSRTKGTFHRDSYVDIGGYAGLGEQLHLAAEVIDAEVVETRVWRHLSEVPLHLTVLDADGDKWRHDRHEGWQCWRSGELDTDINDPEQYEPFTEVVEEPAVVAPRVWTDFSKIPPGVIVADKDNDRWDANDHTFGVNDGFIHERNQSWGPFTEVLL
jgi:hypothetical protein